MTRLLGQVALALALSALGGCAAGAELVASPSDYAAYRRTRVAPSLEARLLAASSYLERFPEGAHAAEVRRKLAQAEPVYFRAKQGSAAGLAAYLKAFPTGAHVPEAKALVRALEARGERDDASGIAAGIDRRVKRLAEQRERVRAEPSRWLGFFLDEATWSRPIRESDRELIVAWSLELPAPVCRPHGDAGARRCAKLLELPFTVVVGAEAEPRQATLEIALVTDAEGLPMRVSLTGPELFVRLEEARAARLEPGEAAKRRRVGNLLANGMVLREMERRFGEGAGCDATELEDEGLAIVCAPFRVRVRPAGPDEADDSIELTRDAAAQASP